MFFRPSRGSDSQSSLPGMGPILGALFPPLCGRHPRLRERRQARRLRGSGWGSP